MKTKEVIQGKPSSSLYTAQSSDGSSPWATSLPYLFQQLELSFTS